MYRVEVSDSAEHDLERIISYIAGELNAPDAASSFADKVYECYSKLEENPFIFEKCRDPKLQQEGYRRVVIKNYLMLYKIYDEFVIVHRFFYGRQNYAELI